jgi:hypothetical protein
MFRPVALVALCVAGAAGYHTAFQLRSPATRVQRRVQSAPRVPGHIVASALGEPSKLDERLYTFNKVVIDR